jgi:hypothetical protein
MTGAIWEAVPIRERLAQLRAQDPDYTRFGADEHRYALSPPLTQSEVARFESEHDVRLPENYRTFLLEVGDGGAGPSYGLYPLSGSSRDGEELAERPASGCLATPFPHTEGWNPPRLRANSEPTAPGALTRAEYLDARWITGSLIIAEDGCGTVHRLIVTGPARGQVWWDDRGEGHGLQPDADFHTWYTSWLTKPGPVRHRPRS